MPTYYNILLFCCFSHSYRPGPADRRYLYYYYYYLCVVCARGGAAARRRSRLPATRLGRKPSPVATGPRRLILPPSARRLRPPLHARGGGRPPTPRRYIFTRFYIQ